MLNRISHILSRIPGPPDEVVYVVFGAELGFILALALVRL
jgi:hypothetical protein